MPNPLSLLRRWMPRRMLRPCWRCGDPPLIELTLEPMRYRVGCCGWRSLEYVNMSALRHHWGTIVMWPWTRAARNEATEKRGKDAT